MARGIWRGMRNQEAVMRFCSADAGLVMAARNAGILRTHWSPSGDAYFDDEDVQRFVEFLDSLRAQRRTVRSTPNQPGPEKPTASRPSKVVYQDTRGHTVDLWLCESCDRAIDRSGRCLGCSTHSRGA